MFWIFKSNRKQYNNITNNIYCLCNSISINSLLWLVSRSNWGSMCGSAQPIFNLLAYRKYNCRIFLLVYYWLLVNNIRNNSNPLLLQWGVVTASNRSIAVQNTEDLYQNYSIAFRNVLSVSCTSLFAGQLCTNLDYHGKLTQVGCHCRNVKSSGTLSNIGFVWISLGY